MAQTNLKRITINIKRIAFTFEKIKNKYKILKKGEIFYFTNISRKKYLNNENGILELPFRCNQKNFKTYYIKMITNVCNDDMKL